MARIPYYEVEKATGKHAEFLGKLGTHMNIYRMLANSENGLKGFIRMGNALLYRCELDPVLRELAIMRVGRLSRAAERHLPRAHRAKRGPEQAWAQVPAGAAGGRCSGCSGG